LISMYSISSCMTKGQSTSQILKLILQQKVNDALALRYTICDSTTSRWHFVTPSVIPPLRVGTSLYLLWFHHFLLVSQTWNIYLPDRL
jgi:hypothetical protein